MVKKVQSGMQDVLLTLPFLKLLGPIHTSCRNPKAELLHSDQQPFLFQRYIPGIFVSMEDSDLGRFPSNNYFKEEFLSISGFFNHFPNMHAVKNK